jgi:hypothetical protein
MNNEHTVSCNLCTEFRCISCNGYFPVKFSPRMNVKLFRDTGGLTPMDKFKRRKPAQRSSLLVRHFHGVQLQRGWETPPPPPQSVSHCSSMTTLSLVSCVVYANHSQLISSGYRDFNASMFGFHSHITTDTEHDL